MSFIVTPLARNAAKALPCRAGEGQIERAVGQALAAVELDDAVAQDRAHGAVHVADRHFQPRPLALRQRIAKPLDDRPVEMVLVRIALWADAAQRAAVGLVRLGEDGREIQPLGLPMVDRLVRAEPLDVAHHVVELAEAKLGHDAADILGHEGEEADDVFGLAVEPLPQIGVLRGNADRARAEMTLPHEDAAQADQGRGAEAEPLGAEQGADHHVAAGPHLAVALHDDAVAEAVEHERLLRLGQADLPRRAGMFDGGQADWPRCRRRAR